MIIYIYGTDSFKKEIHHILNHSNIKFRMDNHGEIIDLKTLNQLKDAISDDPTNIYLIDDSKIIKKNTLQEKIKFLKPKDAIEEEYLLDNGIGDVSVNSMDELSKHIIKKLESMILENESNDIQDSIVEIVEDAYENDDEDSYIELDTELSSLLSHIEPEEDEVEDLQDEIFDISDNTEISLIEDNEDSEDLYFDKNLDNINNNKNNVEKIEDKNEIIIDEDVQGDSMADEFSEFDTLDENDIKAALAGIDDITISKKPSKEMLDSTVDNLNESVNMSGSNVDDIAKLISQLLNNKTLEITVKVKN